MALALDSHRPARRNRQLSSVPAKARSKVTPIIPANRTATAAPIATNDRLSPSTRGISLERQHRSNSSKPVVSFQQTSSQQPMWLQWLSLLQRGSSMLGFCLVAATLAVYGSTVYYQQRWDAASQELEELRRDERQFLEKIESLKQQVAEQTETSQTGLIVPKRENFLYLKPASARPIPEKRTPIPTSDPSAPMGY